MLGLLLLATQRWMERRKERKRTGRKRQGERREPKRDSNSKEDQVTAGKLVPGHAGARGNSQPCARRYVHGCSGLLARGVKSDSQFWYLLRKSIGGIPWLADRKGRKQQQ